ncbi:SRPBCC family protein [Mesorhizobium sp.]|uniref:SRPBCC family protein n=1 Tax=Mesorhizobium sp. TaxID=1871066 RepID=UPI0025DF81B4|nr:SRPBCC family protein [Mesorhizobium sp.]
MKLVDLGDRRFTIEQGLSTEPVGIESYSSPEYFELMKEKVFKKTWLCTGKRVDEIPNPGDYFLEETAITGTSIIIVRGLDGKIRGLHNTCLHRGTQLVFESYGSVKGKFTCIYHGWAYALNGKNVVVTEQEMFFDVDKMDKNLISVAVDVWNGFIFFNLDPNPKESLREHLGEALINLFDDYPFEETTVGVSYRADLDCSWPVLRDSQIDGYHLKYLHSRSAPNCMISPDAPNRHAYDFKLLGKHCYGSFYGNREMIIADRSQSAPVASLTSKVGSTLASDTTAKVDVKDWPKGINPARSKDWFFDILYIFPNFHFIFISNQSYVAHKMMPGKQFDKSSWNARFFAPPWTFKAESLAEQWASEYMKYSLRDLWREDGNTTEGAQRSINAGIFKKMYLQDQEILIRHADNVLNEAVKS